jgi:glycosyltransferase 2 family protein
VTADPHGRTGDLGAAALGPAAEPDVPEPALPTPKSGSRGMAYLRRGFVVAVVLALALLLWRQREEVISSLRSISPGLVVLSLLLTIAGSTLPGVVWRDLLASQGYRTPPVAGLRVFFVAQLGKYLPGGIWNLVAQVGMARDLKVPARQAATATFLSIALSIIAALILAGVTLPFAVPGLLAAYWWAFLAVPVLVALLLPRSVAWWSATAFRILRRPVTPVHLPWGVLLRTTALLTLSWALLGLHLGVLVQGLPGAGGSQWLMSIGLFALAWVAGFLVVVAPAGAGVREAALVLGFAAVLPAGAVLTVAVLSRLLFVVSDVLLAAGFFVAGRSSAAGNRG